MDAPAPGARVLIRNAEWLVRGATLCDLGGYELECLGASKTVRHREALFLTEIDDVKVLDPHDTELVGEDSPAYIGSRLYLEAKLRQMVPTGTDLSLGHSVAIDALPFHLIPSHQVLEQVRPRFLIADSVGLGKTFEAGILLSELMRRGKGRRIFVFTTKSMIRQFQKELWTRFTIPLTRLNSAGSQCSCHELPSSPAKTWKQKLEREMHLVGFDWPRLVTNATAASKRTLKIERITRVFQEYYGNDRMDAAFA